MVPPPAGARLIDLQRYTVPPGLVDAHTHLLIGPEAQNEVGGELDEPPLRVLRAAARARSFLRAGTTTVRDLGDAGAVPRFLTQRYAAASVLASALRVGVKNAAKIPDRSFDRHCCRSWLTSNA